MVQGSTAAHQHTPHWEERGDLNGSSLVLEAKFLQGGSGYPKPEFENRWRGHRFQQSILAAETIGARPEMDR